MQKFSTDYDGGCTALEYTKDNNTELCVWNVWIINFNKTSNVCSDKVGLHKYFVPYQTFTYRSGIHWFLPELITLMIAKF